MTSILPKYILKSAATLGVAGLSMAFHTQTASACDMTLAEMNWASAEVMANIDKIIMETGYGCGVELVPGATQPTVASMLGKGMPDVAPELWYNANAGVLDEAIAEGKIVNAGSSLVDGGIEGYWVPKYMVDKYPELATIDGVKKHPELFPHPEDPDKGAWMNCPSGWNCQISSQNMFDFFGMADAGFELVDSGSSGGLEGSMSKAYERGEGWIGYYWAPTAILGRYEMVKVDPLTGINDKEFKECVTQEGCTVTVGSDFPRGRVDTLVMAEYANENPNVLAYFENRGFSNPDMNAVLAWKEENQADGETTALYFLETYANLWKSWVPADVASKVMSSL